MIRKEISRRGLSLTEVLVSIFILSIGLMALMSLFPIGALQMAQAMKDDRTATMAANADRSFRIFWKEAWLDANGTLLPEATVQSLQPGFASFDNRNTGLMAGTLFVGIRIVELGASRRTWRSRSVCRPSRRSPGSSWPAGSCDASASAG